MQPLDSRLLREFLLACCDSPVLEVGSVPHFSFSEPPRPQELLAHWCGKHRPRSHPRCQRWKVGHCGRRPCRSQWAGEHLCLSVGSPVGKQTGLVNSSRLLMFIGSLRFSSQRQHVFTSVYFCISQQQTTKLNKMESVCPLGGSKTPVIYDCADMLNLFLFTHAAVVQQYYL